MTLEDIPARLAELEREKAELWARLMAPRLQPVTEKETYTDKHGAAEILGIPASYVEDLARRGKLPSKKMGKYRQYGHLALLAWAKEGGLTGALSNTYSGANGRSRPAKAPKATGAHPGPARRQGRAALEQCGKNGAR